MICECGRDQPADEITRDVAGDIGGEGKTCVGGAAFFSQIGKRQRKGGRHAQPLRHAQNRERGQIGRNCQERGRDREDAQD